MHFSSIRILGHAHHCWLSTNLCAAVWSLHCYLKVIGRLYIRFFSNLEMAWPFCILDVFFFCLLLLEAWTRGKLEWDSVSFSLIWVQPCIYVVSFVHAGFHLPYQVHDHQGPSTCILRRVDFSSLTLTWLKHLWFMLVRIIALPEIF